MPRGRPPLRGIGLVPISPRRVGRPPKTDRTALNNGRNHFSGFVPSGVIRSNFPRRFGGARMIMNKVRGRGRPRTESMIVSQFFFDKTPEKQNKDHDSESVEEQPSTSSSKNFMNGSASSNEPDCPSSCSTAGPIVPAMYEDIHLISLVDGAVDKAGTVKDVVSLANFRKLRPECQQYLLRLLPEKDCIQRPDGTLEPTFSALKNEYLSAALLDFHERLYAGEILWTGEIAPLPSTSALPKSHAPSGQESTAPPHESPPSSSDSQAVTTPPPYPPLPKLRINVAAGIITIVPQEEKQNGCSAAHCVNVSRKYASNEDEETSNSSTSSMDGAKSTATETELDFTPYFATRAATGSTNSLNCTKTKLRWSTDGAEFQSFRGRPPANQKARSKKKR